MIISVYGLVLKFFKIVLFSEGSCITVDFAIIIITYDQAETGQIQEPTTITVGISANNGFTRIVISRNLASCYRLVSQLHVLICSF